MGSVDLTGVTPGLFIVNVIFILLVFSMFSMAVLRFFQHRYRSGAIYVLSGLLFAAVFAFVLITWW